MFNWICDFPTIAWSLSLNPKSFFVVSNKSFELLNATPRLSNAVLRFEARIDGAWTNLFALATIWLNEVTKSAKLSPAPWICLAILLILLAVLFRVFTPESNSAFLFFTLLNPSSKAFSLSPRILDFNSAKNPLLPFVAVGKILREAISNSIENFVIPNSFMLELKV